MRHHLDRRAIEMDALEASLGAAFGVGKADDICTLTGLPKWQLKRLSGLGDDQLEQVRDVLATVGVGPAVSTQDIAEFDSVIADQVALDTMEHAA